MHFTTFQGLNTPRRSHFTKVDGKSLYYYMYKMLSFPNDSLRGTYDRITTRMILFVASGVILVNKEFRPDSVPKNRISLNLWKHFQHVYSSMDLKVESTM